MKQKDIALIIVVIAISGALSLVASRMLITSPKNRQEKVEVVEPISADFKQPDNKYFNTNSIDPTQIIKIGDNNNNKPFNQ
ncbi:MAG TPA: hypothetical protein VLF87_00495 [Patescibacteria group bacterium]|nr:hypothetical protein [Candidatus Saccharimonadales bacterium]HSX46458.1 hypothetical protein [Patescibacteria group bacterium]